MGRRTVSRLRPGERLAEDVYTPLGGLLFQKGTEIGERELEILRDFLIESVIVESSDRSEAVEERGADEGMAVSSAATDFLAPLYDEYERLFGLIKKVFPNVAATTGQSLPLLELRQSLKRLLDQIELYDVLTFRLSRMNVNDYFYHNSIMVAMTAFLLAKWHGLEQRDHFPIALAGLLHNIGTLKLDPKLTSKKTTLTAQEKEEMRRHPALGYQLLKDVPGLNEGIKMAALQHHEKEDGSGYPLGVQGDKIHIYAKVVAVADIYHAMTSDRHYKEAESPYLVLEQLFNESFGKLDPALVQTFIHRITAFHHGAVCV